jgi:hypothetical protein
MLPDYIASHSHSQLSALLRIGGSSGQEADARNSPGQAKPRRDRDPGAGSKPAAQ